MAMADAGSGRSALVPAVGRRGSHLEIYVLDEGSESPHGELLADLVEKVGFGWYQALSMPLFLGVALSEGAEMLMTSTISAGVGQDFGLSTTQQASLSSAAFVGLTVGTALSGGIADRYGRRPAILLGYWMQAMFGILSAIATNYHVLLACRLFDGFSCGVGIAAVLALVAETSPLSVRSLSFVITSFALTTGEVWAGIGLFIWMPDLQQGDWRLITLWSTLPSLLLGVLALCWLDESASWLAVVGRLPEARDVLVKMGQWNGTLDKISGLADTAQASSENDAAASKVAAAMPKVAEIQTSTADLVRLLASQASLLRVLLVMSASFIVGNTLGFGMTYVWPRILVVVDGGLEPALAVIVIRSFALPAALWSVVAMSSRLGHRPIAGISAVAAAGGLMWIYTLLENDSTLIVAASVVVVFASNTYYIALMNLCSESFPTVVRALGVGSALTVGRLGAVLTPFIAEWIGLERLLLLASYMCCLASFLMLLVHETKGLPLNDFVDSQPLAMHAKRQSDYGSLEQGASRGDSPDLSAPEALTGDASPPLGA